MKNLLILCYLVYCFVVVFFVCGVSVYVQDVGKVFVDGFWIFVVFGDLCNCGNVVMFVIVVGVKVDGVSFYWYLGDLWVIYKVDEDYVVECCFKNFLYLFSILDYLYMVWVDFIQYEVVLFGDMLFFIGIGNYEVILFMLCMQFCIEFVGLLDCFEFCVQCILDVEYYVVILMMLVDVIYNYWNLCGVDFINFDNIEDYLIDDEQFVWFDVLLDVDFKDDLIYSIVVGLYELFLYSFFDDYSMCQSVLGICSGEYIYWWFVVVQCYKFVYVIVSYEYYYLVNVYDMVYW